MKSKIKKVKNKSLLSKEVNKITKSFNKYWQLYLCLIPVLAFFIIFKYAPMYGVQIAFRDYNPIVGITQSEWVGLKHFERFFNSYYFTRILKNTLGVSLYQLIAGFPAPIILAICINELSSLKFRKTMQMITYAPHFLSVVVVVGLLTSMLSPRTGIINHLLKQLNIGSTYFMAEPAWFKSLYVWSGVWQSTGWGSIIYIAAIAGISPSLYEAAIVDGASKLQRIWHITLPSILPTAIILLIMQSGRIMNIGFQKVYLMQNDLNLASSEVISTFVYKSGLINAQFSFASAVDLFNSVINCILLFIVNKISKNVSETSLF